MKILIDNGHGRATAGKRSPVWPDGKQLFEYEFNRDIARRMHEALTARGTDSVPVVPEIDDIPLAERTRRVNEIAAQVGLTWGGNWKMQDYGHVELRRAGVLGRGIQSTGSRG